MSHMLIRIAVLIDIPPHHFNLLQILCDIIISLKVQQTSVFVQHDPQQQQLLIVGCAYEEGMVDQRLVDCFQERVNVPPPTARERRAVMESVWAEEEKTAAAITATGSAEQRVNNSSFSSSPSPYPYPRLQLDPIADNCAGLLLIPLLCRCRQIVQEVVAQQRQQQLQLQQQRQGTSSDASMLSTSLSLPPLPALTPFQAVAGLLHAKQALTETVLWPRRYAALYRSFASAGSGGSGDGNSDSINGTALNLAAGVLLFGPPGTKYKLTHDNIWHFVINEFKSITAYAP